MMRKWIAITLSFCLLLSLAVPARAAGSKQVESYAEALIQYYYRYQKESASVVWDIVRKMEELDPQQAAMWENLMEDWAWVNEKMPVSENVLPDGLPQDDSLCILVLGFGLAEDGSMKEELVDRLVVALSSALKYPNAWVAVSGGQTSPVKGVTEAGQMASWLKKKGLDSSRILVDNQALSTTANAVNVYNILNSSYPQVDSVALVTSDYHITWGGAMFAAVSNYKAGMSGGNAIELVAAAACDTGNTLDSMSLQAWGISAITGVPFDENAKAPKLYYVPDYPHPTMAPLETEPEETEKRHWPQLWPHTQTQNQEEPAQEETGKGGVLVVTLLGLGAVYVLTPKKPRKKRKKPDWNWDV